MIYMLVNNIVSAILIFLAYECGLINGQKLERNEKISITPNFAEINETKEKEAKQKEEDEKIKKILNNIDVYDGTADGQIEV